MNVESAAATPASARRQIWLCADDYGISPGVNVAIRDLVLRRRINATSVMVAAPSCHRAETLALACLIGSSGVAVGLHVTLSAPFVPLSAGFAPLRDGKFLPLPRLLARAVAHRLQPDLLTAEVTAQVRRFTDLFGRAPDFIDGHQHVHLFPQIRDAALAVAKATAPKAWVRQCGSVVALTSQLGDPKGLLIDLLSHAVRRRAQAFGVRTNPAFAGTYQFNAQADYATLFPRFLDRLPDGSVVMCHPGFVDAELLRLDPLTGLREREYAYFVGDAFPEVLASQGVALA
jgi:predicted glycoside hydrolase/deacetylase ChbG (UPF0249 family)